MNDKINIPEPCSVKWSDMTPVDSSKRHCLSCQTPVVDFTKKSLEEIHDFFSKPGNHKVCGRYNSRDVTPSSAFLEKLDKIEHFFSRFKMRRFAMILIAGILIFSSCRRHIRGKTAGVRAFSKTQQKTAHQKI